MMGRGQLTKIAATVADESPTARSGEIGSLIPANRSICSNGVVIRAFMRAMSSMELTDAELHRLDVDIRSS